MSNCTNSGDYWKMNHARKHCHNHPHPSPQITDSCRSCACGHVYEDRKQIGGKRFSGRNVMTLVITGYWSHLHRVSDIDIGRCKFGQVHNHDPGHLWQFSHLVFRHSARVPNSLSTNVKTPFLQLHARILAWCQCRSTRALYWAHASVCTPFLLARRQSTAL